MHLTPKFTFYSRVSDIILWSKGTDTAVEKGNCNINISRKRHSSIIRLQILPSFPQSLYPCYTLQ